MNGAEYVTQMDEIGNRMQVNVSESRKRSTHTDMRILTIVKGGREEASFMEDTHGGTSAAPMLRLVQTTDGRRDSNMRKLNRMRGYSPDWDGYGALPFPPGMIDQCERIVATLPVQPIIAPTSRMSIDLLFERPEIKGTRNFEIYEDRLGILYIDNDDYGNAREVFFEGDYMDTILSEVKAFYGFEE